MAVIQSPFQATAGTAASLNVLTTAGDMLIENATPANARLPVGGAGELLGISGSLPAWVDPGIPFTPADTGILGWNYDVAAAAVGTALATSGQIVLARINLRAAVSVTNVLYNITVVGNTLTSGQNFAGLYNSSGTLIGTSADQTTNWGSTTGLYTTALASGPFTAGPGFVWVAWLFNGTTGPTISRSANLGPAASVNLGLTAATCRWGHTAGGQTSLASFTPSSTTLVQTGFWAGLS